MKWQAFPRLIFLEVFIEGFFHSTRILHLIILLGLAFALISPTGDISAAGGVTFTVNNSSDADDANIGDGHCDTDPEQLLDQCSLRAAIQESNNLAGAQTITVESGVSTIRLTKALPALSASDNSGTRIYGYQTGKLAGMTVLSGVDITHPANGFVLDSDYHHIQGFEITGFKGHGIVINGNNNGVGVDGDNINDVFEGNVIHSNQDGILYNTLDDGISIAGDNNAVAGNIIGLARDGTSGAPNGNNGITMIGGANHNRIGTNSDGVSDIYERNVIAGDQVVGISIYSNANQNIIAGNYVGLDANSTTGVGSLRNCIEAGGNSNRIGTNGDGANDTNERNVCVGAFSYGLLIIGSDNKVAGNYIGINPSGNTAMPNGGGVLLGGVGNVIGVDGSSKADTTNEGNWIAGNDLSGIEVYGAGVTDNTIAGNFIGVRPSDLTPMPNAGHAIWAYRGSGLVIGTDGDGTADSVEGNYIIASSENGIYINSNQITNTVIAGNTIGQIANGVDAYGIEVSGVNGVRIGSNLDGRSDSLEKNIIRQSVYAGILVNNGSTSVQIVQNEITVNHSGGIVVQESATKNVRISRNIIRDNIGLGINLIGSASVDANDVGDSDSGPNNLQNSPVILSANSNGLKTLIMGLFSGAPNQNLQVEFFSSSKCDSSGYGEGTTYITTISLPTGAGGTASIIHTLPTGLTVGHFLTATATDANGNTSEFSACRLIGSGSGELSSMFIPVVSR